MNYFDKNKKLGKTAEEQVKNHLENRGNIIIDVSEIEEYQEQDIDFIVKNGNQETTLEVKLDNSFNKTDNLFIEDYSIKYDFKKLGWLNYCKADYICYYDTKMKNGIIVDFSIVKSLLDKYAYQKIFYDYQDDKERYCYLLPIGRARQHNAIVYEWIDS